MYIRYNKFIESLDKKYSIIPVVEYNKLFHKDRPIELTDIEFNILKTYIPDISQTNLYTYVDISYTTVNKVNEKNFL